MYSLGLGVGFTSRLCSQCLIMGAGAGKDCGGDVGTGALKNEGNFGDNTVSLLNVCFFRAGLPRRFYRWKFLEHVPRVRTLSKSGRGLLQKTR